MAKNADEIIARKQAKSDELDEIIRQLIQDGWRLRYINRKWQWERVVAMDDKIPPDVAASSRQLNVSWESEEFTQGGELIVVYTIHIHEPEPDRVSLKEYWQQKAQYWVQTVEFRNKKWKSYAQHQYKYQWD